MTAPAAPQAQLSGDEPWLAAVERLRGAYAEKSLAETVRYFRFFEAWCAENRAHALPASPQTVAAYVDVLFGRYRHRTIEGRLRVIRRVHELMGLSEPTQSLPVRLAYRRGRRLHPGRARQAIGLTLTLRDRLLAVCGDDLLGVRDRAIIMLGYDTLCRRSELVALRLEDLRRLPDGSGRILVRRSKSDPFGHGYAAYVSQRGMQAVAEWTQAAGISRGPIVRPVFKTVAGEGPVDPRLVNRRLVALAVAAGLDPRIVARLTSHSLRVGAAQDLATAGRSLIEIMRAGRWRALDSVADYVREAPVNVWSTRGPRE
jgi:integrase/recombinase XerD